MNMKICWTLSALAVVVGSAFAATPKFVPGEILLKMKPGFSAALANRAVGAVAVSGVPQIQVWRVKLPSYLTVDTALRYYRRLPSVQYAEPNYYKQFTFTPNDTLYNQQYAPQIMNVPQAWDLTRGNPAVVVAVIDSGVNYNHPDLAGKVILGPDFGEGDNDPMDTLGHGSHVAGIIGATTNNSLGIAGIGFNVSVLALKIADANNGVSMSGLLEAIVYAGDRRADVINMSLGGYATSQAEKDAVDYAFARNCVIVAAAGNDNVDLPSYPAAFTNVISVGSTDRNDVKSDFSNFGPTVDVAAPGSDILSTVLGSNIELMSGTSMASPAAAGVAALVVSRGGKGVLTNVQVRAAMESTTVYVGNWLQKGRLNAFEAVKKATPLETDDWTLSTIVPRSGFTKIGTVEDAQVTGDGKAFYVQSKNVIGTGQVADAEGTFNVGVDLTRLYGMKFKFRGVAASGASGIVWLYNKTTGAWDVKGTTALGTAYSNKTITVSGNLASYVSAGKVRFVLRSVVPYRLGAAAYPLGLDYVGLETSETQSGG